MNDLKTIENDVISLLKNIPETRDNDMILYYEYCLKNWVREYDMWKVFKDSNFRKSKNIAVFESVSRARRKVQEKYQDLKATEKTQNLRQQKEEYFMEYMKGA